VVIKLYLIIYEKSRQKQEKFLTLRWDLCGGNDFEQSALTH
jgi:hypothetical protein